MGTYKDRPVAYKGWLDDTVDLMTEYRRSEDTAWDNALAIQLDNREGYKQAIQALRHELAMTEQAIIKTILLDSRGFEKYVGVKWKALDEMFTASNFRKGDKPK